jgi:hypothetical protein
VDRLTTAIEKLLNGFADDQIAAMLVCGSRDDRIPKGAKGYDCAKACGLIDEQGGIVHADKFEAALTAEFDRRFGAAQQPASDRPNTYETRFRQRDIVYVVDGKAIRCGTVVGNRVVHELDRAPRYFCEVDFPGQDHDITFNENRLFATEAEARASLKVEGEK